MSDMTQARLLNVSTNPHIVSGDTTSKLMRDVFIALIPATVFGIVNIWRNSPSAGINSLIVVITCIAASMITELIWQKGMKKPVTINDYSAAITGLLIAMNMPPSIPIYMPILGCVFAIIICKQLFGGIGQNFMNPALVGRCFLLLSFGSYMNNFLIDGMTVDGIATATPLAILKGTAEGTAPDLLSMFLGTTGGTIGECSALLLLIGGAFLLIRKVISWEIPVFVVGTFALFMFLFGFAIGHPFDGYFVLQEICGGGLLMGAIFMATDYVTSPITFKGRMLYGFAIGGLIAVFRIFGNSAEGTSFAILIVNIIVPLIERATMPKAFGREGKKA